MAVEANSCVVVGAGISGLLAAHELQNSGWRVTVLDKGRGVGGRMATRRAGGGTFDHGAQFFTVRGERFEKLVEEWMETGAVREWTRGFASPDGEQSEDGHPRYRGASGMTSIPKHLARDLDVHTSERAVEVNLRAGGWEVTCESGRTASGAALLLTAPVPQSLTLAESGGFALTEEIRTQLEGISYDPCVAVMVLLDGPGAVPEPGGMQIRGEPLDWISDNQIKGISESPGITIHAGPKWSREHYEDPDGSLADAIISFAEEQLGGLGARVVETSIARWRYSWVTDSHPEPCLVANEHPPLLFAGDAFGPGKVEGAALSGLAAADRLLGRDG
ncbi:MAG: FAD-dependent oxidoreductase [Actinomycetota bacterium]|nr:FAD-dependent oxidoreductase [Actinomycetota bacterium]